MEILMKELNYAALFIPVFFGFLYLERILIKKSKDKLSQTLEQSLSNISIGIAERLINLFVAVLFYNFFVWIYSNFAIFNIPNNFIVWIELLLAVDFVWYWYHRLGHEINLLWAAHIVHHQSDEFNLTAAARITTIQAFIRYGFWGILPLVGFHPNLVFTILLVHGIYSFFTHTETLKNLKWLESVFITPSLHGVHHASNETYLDKNYGDVFVFWDKLFGTFQKEEEQPVYGLTQPLNSYSFLWLHFHYYYEIYEATKRASGIKAKFKVIFGSPAYMDADIRPYLEKKLNQQRGDKTVILPKGLKNYLISQIFLCVALLTMLTLFFDFLLLPDKIVITLFIIISLIYCGALLEKRKWIYDLEWVRLVIVLEYVALLMDQVYAFQVILVAVLAIFSLFSLREKYLKFIFTQYY
jgi:alkylglycerol monooxygenase